MNPLCTTFLVLLLTASPALAAVLAGWSTNLTSALADAASHDRPVLAYFTASWCGPCKLMAQTTLTNTAVLDALARFSRVAVDIDEQPKIAEQHAVQGVPTFLVLTPTGEEVAQIVGYQEPGPFREWLTNGLGEVKEAVARLRRFQQELAAARQHLRETDPAATAQAVAAFLNLCAEGDGAIRVAATEELATAATNHPVLLLDGLNHARLAARIQAANLLRARLGESFDVDPWSNATARQQGVTRWREKLEATTSAAEATP